MTPAGRAEHAEVPALPTPAWPAGPVPLVHVVRGDPTPTQLAALVTVLVARTTPAPAAEPVQLSAWRDRRAALRAPLAHGPGAWRASGLPR